MGTFEEKFAKNRWVAYGTLVVAICTGVAVIITALGDLEAARNPRARPDSFTASDFHKYIAAVKTDLRRECGAQTTDLQHQITTLAGRIEEFKFWRDTHTEWGTDLSLANENWKGRIEAEHAEFHRKFLKLE